MGSQLVLLDNRSVDWRLDDRTREIGRRGLAAAREALAEAMRRGPAGAKLETDTPAETTTHPCSGAPMHQVAQVTRAA